MFALVAAGLVLAGSVQLDVAGRVLDALQAARSASGVAPSAAKP